MPISRPNNHSGIRLTKRLAAAADAVRGGCRFADAGCDHGKLTAHLIVSGKCRYGYATDISGASLDKARALFHSLGIEDKTEPLLLDGLSGIDGRLVDDAVIAGLGFDVTAKMIGEAHWLRNPEKRLVLAPSSRHERLRRYLYAEGFQICAERAVAEAGHIYTVITAEYCGVRQTVSPVFAAFGKTLDFDGDKDEYTAYVARKNRMLIEEIENARVQNVAKIREARDILKFIDKVNER